MKASEASIEHPIDLKGEHDDEHDADKTLPLSSDEEHGPTALQDRNPCIHIVDIFMKKM